MGVENSVSGANSKAYSIGFSIDNTVIGLFLNHLVLRFGNRFLFRSLEFIFPSDDRCGGKPSFELGKNFRSRFEMDRKGVVMTGDFRSGEGALRWGGGKGEDIVVTQCGAVKEKIRLKLCA